MDVRSLTLVPPTLPLESVRAAADAAWTTISAERPGLAPAVDLQRRLVGRQIDLLGGFSAGGVPNLNLPGRYVAAKLKRGVPALSGEPVPLPVPVLTFAIRDACDALGTTTIGAEARAVGEAVASGKLDVTTLAGAVFARDQRSARLLARSAGVAHELVWLAADNALAPYTHLVMRRVPGADVWAGWERGRCPACGTWPVGAEAIDGRHVLRCAFCAAAWARPFDRCTYCGDERWVPLQPDPDRPGRRVMICDGCKGYLKVLDLPALQPFPLPTIADLATFDLDQIAMERGCRKPAL